MRDDLLNFNCEPNSSALIKVIGVGGGGSNAVNYMYRKGIKDVGFVVCNTDAQALENSPVPLTVQLGESITGGRGAGNMPELGEQSAEESLELLRNMLENNTRMAFITAGMGGGTGTGAAPVIARLCRQLDILTIAVVTVPSRAEGHKRYNQALDGIEKIKEHVDSLLVINNEKIREIYGNLPASQAFAKADEILATAVKGIAEIITLHGNINIDFADVNTVMTGSKVFIMGTGFAEGEGRALSAVEAALDSPLLDSNDINGTSEILLNITSGIEEITIGEIGEIIECLQKKAGQNANIIWGNGHDLNIGNQISVTIIATGFKTNPSAIMQKMEKKATSFVPLESNPEGLFIPDDADLPDEESETAARIPEAPGKRTSEPIKKPLRNKESKQKANNNSWIKRQLDLFFEEKSTELD
ncbi:MAG: cell division protein FtsZ [Prolixibacteraceae bacterium]|nr:cell division protein FtsZ [Prolixibacteraceae bacterium]